MTICHHGFFPDFIVCPKMSQKVIAILKLHKKLQGYRKQKCSIVMPRILAFKCHRLDIFTFVTFCAILKTVMKYNLPFGRTQVW